MTTTIAERISVAVAAGRAREAADLLAAERPPLDPALAVVAAEALAATGRERRAAALLLLAARRHGSDRTVVLEAARALLRRGQHRRAGRVLTGHDAPVLAAIAARQAVPTTTTTTTTDLQDEIDRALATPTPTPALAALLERAPTSTRLRVATAARALDEGRGADARAILRAGLQGRDDARLEVALATVAVATGTWDEAAVVIARARSRFPPLARDPALLALLGLVTLAAGRRDDALSVLHGGARHGMVGALQALLTPPPAPPKAATGTTATTATTTAARPLSPLMQETLARAGQLPSPGSLPTGPSPSPTTGPGTPASLSTVPPATEAPADASAGPPVSPSTTTTTTPPPSEPSGATRRPGAATTTTPPKAEVSGATRRPTMPTTATPPPPKAEASGATPRPTPTFRRLEIGPDERSGRGLPIALAVVAVIGLGLVLGPRLWGTQAAVDDENAGRTGFAQQLTRCGLTVPGWVDLNVAPSSLAPAVAAAGWGGHPASVDGDAMPVDPMLQPGVKLLSLRTGAALEPSLVVTPAGDRTLGIGWAAATTERPLVSTLVGALKFDHATPWSCPQAGAGASCVVGRARCEDLVIRVQAICVGQTTASLLSRCALDAAVVGPAALLPPATATPPVPASTSSLSGTDLVVNEP
jgi:hypothetical protein